MFQPSEYQKKPKKRRGGRPPLPPFWELVKKGEPDECWLWQGKIWNKFGYGSYSTRLAHRVAVELSGRSIPKGSVVRHTCDNPPCCNPAHLVVGTQRDNIYDSIERGRFVEPPGKKGEELPFAKLTEVKVREMRQRHEAGETILSLAHEYGVAFNAAWMAIRRKTWKHVK